MEALPGLMRGVRVGLDRAPGGVQERCWWWHRGGWQRGTQVAEAGQPCAGAGVWGLGWGKFNKSYGGLLPELGLMGCQRRQGCLDLLIPWAWGTIHLALTLF